MRSGGVSSLAGPALGGVLTDYLSWRWVFFVTVPFAAASAWILVTHVNEEVKRREVLPIDWSGAALLTAGSTVLLLAVLGGHERSWRGGVLLYGAAAALLVLFVRRERRAADPVLPVDLLVSMNTSAAIFGGFLIGAILFGADTYIPLFVQGVKGGSATAAGRALTPLFLVWALSVAVAARVVVRLGYRRTAVFGSLLATVGLAGVTLGAAWPAWSGPLFLGSLLVIGSGMGPLSLSHILAVQNAVPWGRRGAATATVVFFRTLGGAVMVAVLGASLALGLGRRLADTPGVDVAAALQPRTHDRLSPSQLAAVRGALGRSLRDVFLQMSGLAALGVVCSFGLKGGRATSHHDAGTGPDAAEPPDGDLALALSAET